MNDASVTRILILAEPATGAAWAELLCGPHMRVWLGRDAIPPGEHPEIILAGSHSEWSAARDEVGVVLVGGSGAADVVLPADCAADELGRVCQLLGEIVRLRRRDRDATQIQQELAAAALTDPLTGLPNRRAWDDELARRIADVSVGKRLCLAVLDLDRFKEVNDTLGHAAGDRLLREVARAMQKNLRQGDFVARLGGDEFGILLWLPAAAEAVTIVERIRGCVAYVGMDAGFDSITASTGYALSGTSPEFDSAESLFLAADSRLIAAKRKLSVTTTLASGDETATASR